MCSKIIMMSLSVFLLVSAAASADGYSDFAAELVDFSGNFGSQPYDDPCAVLGKPTTICRNAPYQSGGAPFRVKLVEPAYNVDINEQKIVTTIEPGEYIVVKFDHKVVDYSGNYGGMDFIVFGNSRFEGNGSYVDDQTNMNSYPLTVGGYFEQIRASVSQDGINWFTYTAGPFGDDYFPTQAYVWDRENARWTDEEMDFTRPVDPNLTLYDFERISAADAIDLYDGSGGGTAYDLRNLADYNDLAVDPNTGYRWIQYVKLDGYQIGGEIDAVSDVAACGDPTHPYPLGDINKDCRVDFKDMADLAANWLKCTYNCD